MRFTKLAILILIAGMLISAGGCAGRNAHPIAAQQIGDANRSCETLRLLVSTNEASIIRKMKQDEAKLLSNIWWFLWFPPLMDVKGAEKCEAEALRVRNNYLRILMNEKGCTN